MTAASRAWTRTFKLSIHLKLPLFLAYKRPSPSLLLPSILQYIHVYFENIRLLPLIYIVNIRIVCTR